MSSRSLLVVVVLALTATPAAAQQRGRLEIGGFARYTYFDDSWLYDDAFGGGGRLGVFLLPRLLVEADATYTATVGWADEEAQYIPFHAYLVYSQPLGQRLHLRVGAGYVHNEYRQRRDGADNGMAGLLALHLGLVGPLALRLDGTVDYISVPANLANENWHFGVQAGLSFLIGRIGGPTQSPVVVAATPQPAEETPPEPQKEVESDAQATVTPDSAALAEPETTVQPAAPDTSPTVQALPTRPRRADPYVPPAPPLPRVGETVVLEGVGFASGTAVLAPGSEGLLDQLAHAILATPEATFEIGGYTDDSGPHDLNLRLSLARANVVRWYLMDRGVDPRRLVARGYGPADPLTGNESPEDQARNRRVELRRLN